MHRFPLIMPCFAEPHASSRGGQKIQVATPRLVPHLFERFASRVRQHEGKQKGLVKETNQNRLSGSVRQIRCKRGASTGQARNQRGDEMQDLWEADAETCASLSLRAVMLWYVAIMQRTNPDATRIS